MTVRHHTGEYEITFVGLPEAVAALPADAIVVTDENVNAAWGEALGPDRRKVILPPGEASKSLETYGAALSKLAECRASRRTTIVAFGGGVIGDLAGFLAATYMRGVPFIQIPTTLLSQVDSSVGGKVGIDLPEGKNLVGAFYPPSKVWICLETLGTLDKRQINNGMAEVWKYGFIMDEPFLRQLEEAPHDYASIVQHCITLKAQVVEEDEFETLGRRAILNYGHTVGHAIEQVTHYGPILHGEAISIGMTVEARLGERLGVSPIGTQKRVATLLQKQGLPTTNPILSSVDALLDAMRKDKKAIGGSMAFSLLTHMGGCRLVNNVAESDVRTALQGI